MRLLGLLFAWMLLAAVAEAHDWPHWRGPEMTGVSREKNLPSDWSLETKKNVVWVSEIGGRSTPIVMNGRVYLNCRTPQNTSHTSDELAHAGERVVCFDAETGEVLWQDKFPVFNTDIPSPRVGWASMVGDPETGNVYTHSVSGTFRCYSADGKRIWEVSGAEDFGEITGFGGRIATPLIVGDKVILAFACLNWGDTAKPPPKHTFYAFDKMTGELLWTAAPGGALNDTFQTSPVVAVVDGVRQIISGCGDGGVYGINAHTGEKLWGMRLTKRGLNASVVVDGTYVYASHGEDDLVGREFGRVQCIDATKRGDLTGSGGVWKVNGVKAGYASPCVHDGVLYIVSDSADLIAFDSKNGDRLWTYPLGSVGKGSPVYADGKIYVMEVNGRIHIIKADRNGAEKLSLVQLPAVDGLGFDPIYASPAIANGRVYFVTRDRTICIAKEGAKAASDPLPPTPPERDPTGKVASIVTVPYEVNIKAGETVEYEVRAFDENGRFLHTIDEFTLTPGDGLKGGRVDGLKFTTAADVTLPQAGVITVKAAGLTDTVRIRSWPPLPWKFDFEGLTGTEIPAGWVRGFLKLKPVKLDGNTVLKSEPGKGRPSFTCWIGPSTMSEYVIQADVMTDGRRRLSNIGLMNQRYNFILKANSNELALQTWAAHQRLRKQKTLEEDTAGKWYTLKLAVNNEDGKTHLRGKMWPRGEKEPSDWTLETTDPMGIFHGSPGLFTYRLSEAYIDNVIVSDAK